MIYKNIEEIPSEGKSLIIELINKGAIECENGKITLSQEVYETLIILAKIGII